MAASTRDETYKPSWPQYFASCLLLFSLDALLVDEHRQAGSRCPHFAAKRTSVACSGWPLPAISATTRMPSSFDDSAPLLQFPGSNGAGTFEDLGDTHEQFCKLIGVRPIHLPKDHKWDPHPDALYVRVKRRKRNQSCTYQFTAALTNTLMLTQIVLGATLTALGASDSSRVLITVFGALNTVIAGMIAFLKSRGQLVRARMFRDDLARVIDEIEVRQDAWSVDHLKKMLILAAEQRRDVARHQ